MNTQLEDLPNELIWFIMEYLPPLDLFRTFFHLNQRFNTILYSIHYRLNLLSTNQNQFDYFLHTILPNIQCNRIESFYLDDILHRLDSIKICHNLRSLTIDHLHAKNLDLLAKKILPELKQLNYLHLSSDFLLPNANVNVLTSVIFSEQLPSLTYCYFAFEDFGRMSFDHLDRIHQTLSLKILIIDQWCHLRDFLLLLHFIPNIQRLTVRLFDSNTKGTIVRSLNTIDDFTILVPHLIYLRAKLSQISFSTAMKVLFHRLPAHLRELSLSTWSIDYSDGESWENLLSWKFPRLKHFRLIISLDQLPPSHSLDDLDQLVKSFNQSKYFLDHQWNVLLNINERDRLKFVLHSIPYPIENFQTTLYNIRRCTASSTSIRSTYSDVKKLSLTLHDDVANDEIEYRYFSRVDQLIFLSNLTNDCQQFQSREYFSRLSGLINLENITSLSFPEITHQYPMQLLHILLANLPELRSLTLSHRLFVCLQPQSLRSLKSLDLIFAVYSSVSPPVTRMRHLLSLNQILTNDLIVELLRTVSTFDLQTLSFIVRDVDGFDQQFSEWLKRNISISYDLLLADKILRFYF